MATQDGPRIVTAGLVLCLDTVDRNSYISGSTLKDMSGNDANFSSGCVGTGCTYPTISGNGLKTGFTTSTSKYFDCTNVNTTLKNLLYGDHTIEVACKINSLTRGIDLNAAYTTEVATSMIIWPGNHSGLYMDNTNIYYAIWNGVTNTQQTSTGISNYVGKNIIINAVRISNTLYLYFNGSLITSSNITAPANFGYNNLRLGIAITSYPVSTNNYSWPSNIDFYSVKLYNKGFTANEVQQNFNVMRSRFGI